MLGIGSKVEVFYRSVSNGGAGGNFDSFEAFDSFSAGKLGKLPVDDVVLGGYRERNAAFYAFARSFGARDSAVGEGRVEVEVGLGDILFCRWKKGKIRNGGKRGIHRKGGGGWRHSENADGNIFVVRTASIISGIMEMS